MATPRRSYSVYPPLILAYLCGQAIHSLTFLSRHIAAQNPSQTTRTSLQLLSTLALAPAVHSTRPSTATTPRHPILSAFVTSLVTVIASVVRLIFLFQFRTPAPPASILPPLLASVVVILLLRVAPPLTALRSSTPPFLQLLVAHPIPRKRRAAPPHDAVAGPALLAVLLHAASDAFARVLECVAFFTSGTVLSARIADALAAILAVVIAYPLLRLSMRVLVHAAPGRIAALARARCDMLTQVDGVVRCVNLHVWEESVGVFVGTVSVVVAKSVETSAVLEKAIVIFDDVLHDLTVQVETVHGDDAE